MSHFKIALLFSLWIIHVPLLSQTNYWQGDSWPFAWSNDASWSLGHVPTSTEHVVIPGGLTNYPFVLGFCYANDLVLSEGASMEIRNGLDLDISGNFEIGGTITHFGTTPTGIIEVGGYVRWHPSSLMEEYWQDPEFTWRVYGNWYFENGCEVDMNHHTVEYRGSSPAYIYTKSANAKFYRISPRKSSSTLTWSSTSTYDLECNYLNIFSGCTFQTWSTRSIKVITFFTNGGGIQLNNGTFKWGYSGGTVSVDGSDYFNNLELHPYYTTGTTFNGEVIVNGNFTAEYGGPSPGGLYFNDHLTVKGDFISDMGNMLSINKLTFNGPGVQECLGARTDTLVLAKTDGDELRMPSDSTIAGQYDWTSGWIRVNGGTFIANDLIDPGIYGTISLTSGKIQFTQDPSQYIDLRGYVFISSGEFVVYGGSGDSYWPWGNPATLAMNGGTIYMENGIYINNNSGFTDNITGGTIITKGDFRVVRSDFNPTGGTLLLQSSFPFQDTVRLQCNPGSNLHNVWIEKTTGIDVVTTSDIDIHGNLMIAAGDLKSDDQIQLKGNWSSFSFAFEGAGSTVTFNGNGAQTYYGHETFNNLILDNDFDTLFLLDGAYMNIQSYNWEGGSLHMDDATVWIYDLADFGLYGSYILENDTYLNIVQDPAQTLDFNAHISILSSSDMDLYGGNGTSDWANFTDASLTMDDDCYLFLDGNGIHIHNSHSFTENINGGIIQLEGNFDCDRSDFTPANGTVILSGAVDIEVDMTPGSYFHDLWIYNVGFGGITDTVIATSDLIIQHDFKMTKGTFIPQNLQVGRDWTNDVSQDAFVEGMYKVSFNGNQSAYLNNSETFYDVEINKPLPNLNGVFIIRTSDSMTIKNDLIISDGLLEMDTSSRLFINDDVLIGSGAGLNAYYDPDLEIIVGGDWTNLNSTAETYIGFYPGTSKVTFDGYNDQNIDCHTITGDFYNLEIKNHDYDVWIVQPIHVMNDLKLIKGTTHAPDSIWVGGDWTNIAGNSGFDEGTGIVIFNGNGPSDLLTNETFYDLRLTKTYTSFDGFELMAGNTMTVLNDLNIYTGTMEMNDNSILDVNRDLSITANAGLNADDSGLLIFVGGDWSDLNTAWSNKIGFNPGTSKVTFDGLDDQSVFCNATDADFYKLFIDKPSDLNTDDFVAFHTNIKILKDAEVLDGRWYDLPTGGFVHQFYGRVIVNSGAKWFGGNSTIIFKANGDQKWAPSPTLLDCSYHNVTIDKPAGVVLLLEDARSLNGGFLSVQNGTFDLNGNKFYGAGNAEVLSTGEILTRPSGELWIGLDPM